MIAGTDTLYSNYSYGVVFLKQEKKKLLSLCMRSVSLFIPKILYRTYNHERPFRGRNVAVAAFHHHINCKNTSRTLEK